MKGTTNAQRNAVVGSSSAVDKLTLTMADGTTQQHTVSNMIPKDTEPTTGSAKFVTSGAIKTALDKKVDAVSGKGLSTNDYTTTEKNKLAGISAGAQINVIEEVQLNGAKITPSSKAVNIDLSGYATKGDLSAIPKFAISVVSELPTSGISTSTIYLKPNGGSSGNSYDEYLYVNSAWEKIGTTEVDLSGYVPTSRKVNGKALTGDITLAASDVGALATSGTAAKATADASGNNIVNTYATKTELTNGLAGKQNNLTFDSAPTSGSSNPVTSGGVYSAINAIPQVTVDSALSSSSTNPVQNKVVNTALSNKMDKVTSIGSSSKPIYINSSGVPTACSYSLGEAASKSVTTSVTSGSSALVTSGAVYTAINNIKREAPLSLYASIEWDQGSNANPSGGISVVYTITPSKSTPLSSNITGTLTISGTYKTVSSSTMNGHAILRTSSHDMNNYSTTFTNSQLKAGISSSASMTGRFGGLIYVADICFVMTLTLSNNDKYTYNFSTVHT